MLITPTKLRANLYKIIDKVIATGKPVEIERHGHIVKIIAEAPKSKLANLIKHPGTIKGDPEELVHLDWYHEWSGK
jgi:antitoxin (DNA-binding transcriptional repressor) of toxin-antitoxin stability system